MVIPMTGNPRKKTASENSPLAGYPPALKTGSDIEIVSREVAPRAPGVTIGGKKTQDALEGRFEHESKTGSLKGADCGATVMLIPPDCPEVIVTQDGLARSAMEELGAGAGTEIRGGLEGGLWAGLDAELIVGLDVASQCGT